MKRYNNFINEKLMNLLVKDFLNHYYNNGGININNVPKEILNKFPEWSGESEFDIKYVDNLDENVNLYAGVDSDRDIKNIRSWTLCGETAESFSDKYENGKVIELPYKDFIKTFKLFVSMDVIYNYICENNLYVLDDYVSESEIFTFSDELDINIIDPTYDGYNEIFVGDEKVGYIDLSPARKEYYWLDINLDNPLALCDIKIYDKFRQKNYMKKVMYWLYDFAKQQGFNTIFLRVDDDSEVDMDTLISIYSKMGFLIYKTYSDEDDVFMYKKI